MLSMISFASDHMNVEKDTMREHFLKNLHSKGFSEKDLVSTEDTYYEIIKKTELTEDEKVQLTEAKLNNSKTENNSIKEVDDSYVSIKRSKNDYLNKTMNESKAITRGVIGDNTSRSTSWIKLTLSLYQNSNDKFSVYSFWEWLTVPVFTRTDINNIYFSSNVTTVPGTQVGYYEAWKKDWGGVIVGTPYSESTPAIYHPKGVAQKMNLLTMSDKQWHRGYLGTNVTFRTSQRQIGDIYTEYIHTQIKLSSVGFSSSGAVSVGAGWGEDRLVGPHGQINNK